MKVLAVIHGANVRGGVFQDVVEETGHRYDEWSLATGAPSPRPLDEYQAVIVFGGSMHADQDDRHPWLRDENELIRELLERRVPLLGVCLGIQLIAKAAGAAVYPVPDGPEIGWLPVELTDAADDDPVFSYLPKSFDAFGWHYYTYDLPERAVELGRSARCNQAFRLGENAWGVQFHPEVTPEIVASWLEDEDDFPADLDRAQLEAESQRKLGAWNDLGRTLCGGFLELAERLTGGPRESRAQLAELGS